MEPPRHDRSILAALLLVGLVAAVYAQVARFGFVAFDDGRYVTENPVVRNGLTAAGLRWAFTTFHASNWHPLTWISHMLDVSLFGLDAGRQHLVNVGFHTADTLLLFFVLRAATGRTGRSTFVAALFAVHPLHVESVAWIAERKDVLSTFFWLTTLAAYVHYTRRPGRGRYLLVCAAFALGLLSKPMLVSLPFVLLLFDVWPLARTAGWATRALEKLPLLAMAAGSSIVTLAAQWRGGTVSGTAHLPPGARLSNAVLAAGMYLWKTVWPSRLAVFYPHPTALPGGVPAWKYVLAAAALAAITCLVLRERVRRPYLAVGWGWFLVALVPVIGIVQVGAQGMADRYTYVPSIGLFVAVAWSAPFPAPPAWVRAAVASGAAAVVLALAAAAHAQAGTWRDSYTLFRHAADVTDHNWLADRNLGVEQFRRGEYAAAETSFRSALATWPDDAGTWVDLAAALAARGAHADAARSLRQAVRLDPRDAEAWFNLGIAGAFSGDRALCREAIERLRGLDPRRGAELESRIDALR